jgi:hypothetical protein
MARLGSPKTQAVLVAHAAKSSLVCQLTAATLMAKELLLRPMHEKSGNCETSLLGMSMVNTSMGKGGNLATLRRNRGCLRSHSTSIEDFRIAMLAASPADHRKKINSIFIMTCRDIWRERNERIFKQKETAKKKKLNTKLQFIKPSNASKMKQKNGH